MWRSVQHLGRRRPPAERQPAIRVERVRGAREPDRVPVAVSQPLLLGLLREVERDVDEHVTGLDA